MKNQISALSDPRQSLDHLLENWFGVGNSWFKYYNSINAISYIICILPVFQDYCFFVLLNV